MAPSIKGQCKPNPAVTPPQNTRSLTVCSVIDDAEAGTSMLACLTNLQSSWALIQSCRRY